MITQETAAAIWSAYREIRDALDMTFADYLRWPRRKEHEATFQL